LFLEVTGFDTLKGITNEVLESACDESDYLCDSCPTGFCLCGMCQGCPGGCPGVPGAVQTDSNTSASAVGLIAGLVVAGVVVIAAAVGGIIWYLKKRAEKTPKTDEERPTTVDIEDRSERYSKLVRKFSTNEDKRVTKPLEE